MKIARYEAHGDVHYGVVDGDNVTAIDGSPFGNFTVTDHVHKLSDVKLLGPVVPGKILAMGLNYTSHIRRPPRAPSTRWSFTRHPPALLAPRTASSGPRKSQRFDAEGEMVVVIKDDCRYVSKEDALNHVLGYTCGNDVSARDWQRRDRNENNSDLVARQVCGHFLAHGPMDRHRRQPGRPVAPDPRQRQRGAGPEHQGPDL